MVCILVLGKNVASALEGLVEVPWDCVLLLCCAVGGKGLILTAGVDGRSIEQQHVLECL